MVNADKNRLQFKNSRHFLLKEVDAYQLTGKCLERTQTIEVYVLGKKKKVSLHGVTQYTVLIEDFSSAFWFVPPMLKMLHQ